MPARLAPLPSVPANWTVLERLEPFVPRYAQAVRKPLTSHRTADMVQRLLAEVARRQASFVIVDLTGIEIVDTKTADHLLKLIRKVELVDARCVLKGARRQLHRLSPTLADGLRWPG